MTIAMSILGFMAFMNGFNALCSLWRIWWPISHAEARVKQTTKALEDVRKEIGDGRVRWSLLTCVSLTLVSFAMSAVTIVAIYVVLDAVPR